jgi:hypothetical protein
MAIFHIIETRTVTSNTPAHGFGDYPERINYVTLTVEADTFRKAQNTAKKIDATLRFGGQFGNQVLTEAELANRKGIERPPWGAVAGTGQWRQNRYISL